MSPMRIDFEKQNSDGTPQFSNALPEGRRCDHYTSNFCDRTTWYEDSLREADVAMVDSGDHTIFNLNPARAIADLKHGKVFGEDYLAESYGAVVLVDGQAKIEHSPGTTDGDYARDYSTGAVIFKTALAGTEAVTSTHSKIQTSLCKVKPPEGCKLRVGYVEVQFSKDIGLKDTLNFQLWGDVGEGMQPLSGIERYKVMTDYIADAEKAYPLIPVFDGASGNWRMNQVEIAIFRFDYTNRASTDLLSSLAMEIRVWLDDDQEFDGSYAVGTFYGVKEEEGAE